MVTLGSSRFGRPEVAGSYGTRVEVWRQFTGGNVCEHPRELTGNERKRLGLGMMIRSGDSLRTWPSGRVRRGAPSTVSTTHRDHLCA
jgi:hypothetical protein